MMPHYEVSMPFLIRPSRRFPLTYLLNLCALTPLLVLSSGPVYAEWVAIEDHYQSPGLRTVYFDPDTIDRNGHLVTIWQLTDYRSVQGNVGLGRFGVDPSRFVSTKTHKQFDCVEKRIRLLAYMEFLQPMETGRRNKGYVDKDNWLPIEPESINQALWNVACGKS
jgi:hypothetical protein